MWWPAGNFPHNPTASSRFVLQQICPNNTFVFPQISVVQKTLKIVNCTNICHPKRARIVIFWTYPTTNDKSLFHDMACTCLQAMVRQLPSASPDPLCWFCFDRIKRDPPVSALSCCSFLHFASGICGPAGLQAISSVWILVAWLAPVPHLVVDRYNREQSDPHIIPICRLCSFFCYKLYSNSLCADLFALCGYGKENIKICSNLAVFELRGDEGTDVTSDEFLLHALKLPGQSERSFCTKCVAKYSCTNDIPQIKLLKVESRSAISCPGCYATHSNCGTFFLVSGHNVSLKKLSQFLKHWSQNIVWRVPSHAFTFVGALFTQSWRRLKNVSLSVWGQSKNPAQLQVNVFSKKMVVRIVWVAEKDPFETHQLERLAWVKKRTGRFVCTIQVTPA